MIRRDNDPTVGNMTEVDWTDPQVSTLLAATDTFRLDNRGTHAAEAVQLRSGGSGPERPALLVGEAAGRVLRVLYDQALPAGHVVALKRDRGGAIGTEWEMCSVISCRPGARAQDTALAIHVLELQAQPLRPPHLG